MRDYDSNSPLIVLHIPKTAGISVREIFQEWYGDGLLLHYFNDKTEEMPRKYEFSQDKPIAIYGHFNKNRGYGAKQYYPDAKQFITILRDPFERALSGYFFRKQNSKNWKDQSQTPTDIRKHLLNPNRGTKNHFPYEINLDNYKEILETHFIEVGITEYLDESMSRIAQKLNKEYKPGTIKHLNTAKRDQSIIPYDLKEEFMEMHQLDYAIYNYVLSKYT